MKRLEEAAAIKTKNVLEAKKIQDVSIQLSSMKVAPSEIVDSLLAIDEYNLSEDQLAKLLRMSPNAEEEKVLKENIAISDQLSKQEQFLLQLMKVPNLKGHLSCIMFKICFSANFLKLNDSLKVLKKSIVSIEDNYELEQVFAMILKIGNFLNQGTNKGNVLSFQLSLLNTLSLSKGVGRHSKSNMFDFLLHTILAKQPHVVAFATKLAPCEEG